MGYTAEQIAAITDKTGYRSGCTVRCTPDPCDITSEAFVIYSSEIQVGGSSIPTLDEVCIRLSLENNDQHPATKIVAAHKLIVISYYNVQTEYDLGTLDPSDPTKVCFTTSGTPLMQNAENIEQPLKYLLIADIEMVGGTIAEEVMVELNYPNFW